MRCTAADIGRVFPDVIWHTEKPIRRTAPAPLFLLSKFVRERGCKVVVSGEGSDEMFGGYDIFKEAKIRRFCAARPDSTLRPRLLSRLYPYIPEIQAQPSRYLGRYFQAEPNDLCDPFFSHGPRWKLTAGIKLFLHQRRALRAALGTPTQPHNFLKASQVGIGWRKRSIWRRPCCSRATSSLQRTGLRWSMV